MDIGTVNNLYLYYSSDPNRCLVNDYAPGSIVYVNLLPQTQHRTWWYVLIKEKDYLTYFK